MAKKRTFNCGANVGNPQRARYARVANQNAGIARRFSHVITFLLSLNKRCILLIRCGVYSRAALITSTCRVYSRAVFNQVKTVSKICERTTTKELVISKK